MSDELMKNNKKTWWLSRLFRRLRKDVNPFPQENDVSIAPISPEPNEMPLEETENNIPWVVKAFLEDSELDDKKKQSLSNGLMKNLSLEQANFLVKAGFDSAFIDRVVESLENAPDFRYALLEANHPTRPLRDLNLAYRQSIHNPYPSFDEKSKADETFYKTYLPELNEVVKLEEEIRSNKFWMEAVERRAEMGLDSYYSKEHYKNNIIMLEEKLVRKYSYLPYKIRVLGIAPKEIEEKAKKYELDINSIWAPITFNPKKSEHVHSDFQDNPSKTEKTKPGLDQNILSAQQRIEPHKESRKQPTLDRSFS